jgi:hypothetical protein
LVPGKIVAWNSIVVGGRSYAERMGKRYVVILKGAFFLIKKGNTIDRGETNRCQTPCGCADTYLLKKSLV